MHVRIPVTALLVTVTTTLLLTACGATPTPGVTPVSTPAAQAISPTPGQLVITQAPAPTITASPRVTVPQPTQPVAAPSSPAATAAPAPTIKPTKVTIPKGTGSVAARQEVATATAKFYTHFYNYPAATSKKLDGVVPDTTYTDKPAKPLSATEAKRIRTKMENIDPQFLNLDTRKLSDAEKVSAYTSMLYIGAYTRGQGISAKVDAAQVSVQGTTASVSGTALSIYKNGKLFASGADGTSGGFSGGISLHHVGNRWLIGPA